MKTHPLIFFIFVFCFVLVNPRVQAEVRTWTSGKHTVDAKLIGLTDDGKSVKLRRSDNKKEIVVPLEKLSPEDREYIARLPKEKTTHAENPSDIEQDKPNYDDWTMTSLHDVEKEILSEIELQSGKKASVLTTQMKDGFHVDQVAENNSAAIAGLEESDIIVSFNGKRFKSMDLYNAWLKETSPESIALTVFKRSDDYKRPAKLTVAPSRGEIKWPIKDENLPNAPEQDFYAPGAIAKQIDALIDERNRKFRYPSSLTKSEKKR